ncbi:hypothetical protein HGRIS_010608 [Hohenbuehelia grisea]|uniref:G domain-containing protein n=1 Tax=Hohenbuehelia grisea TaxID=104357 RepID=A0ABR3IXB7_9AGAR
MSGSGDSESLYVTDISITSPKVTETLDVHLDEIPRTPVLDEKTEFEARWKWRGDGMEISPRSRLVVKPLIKRSIGILKAKRDPIAIPVEELFRSCGAVDPRGEWKKSYPKFELTIGLSPPRSPHTPQSSRMSVVPNSPSTSATSLDSDLPSTTDDLKRICPRFRVLVIGRTGVGKSSLINHAFGVTEASVSKGKAGVHDINFEIESKDNPHFVVHDSQGLEPGEINNFKIATDFIERRKRMRELKDKLHAIWLCIEIPCAGARVFETGDESFIKLDLGHVPVIVVFTKFDQLVDREEMKLSPDECAGLTPEEVLGLARAKATTAFEEICLEPLKQVVSKPPLWIKVSSETGYQETLSALTKVTYDNVKNYVAEEASLVTAIAQRTSPDTKIYASIAVGKSKYWQGLGCSTRFPGRTLRSCLDVLHKDIVAVWNFHDPKMHLASKEFKALMTQVVNDLAENDAMDPNKSLVGGLSLIGTIAGVVGGLSGPAAPIVIPIVASFVFAKWVYDVYQQSRSVLRILMGYIVDLTIIMQTLFLLTRGDARPLTRRVVKLATAGYMESVARSQSHAAITDYVQSQNAFKRMDRDCALSLIVQLIEAGCSQEAEVEKVKQEKLAETLDDLKAKDEPWDVVVPELHAHSSS